MVTAVWSVVAPLLAAGVAGLVAAVVYPLVQGIIVEPVNALREAIRDADAILTHTAQWWANPVDREEAGRLAGHPVMEPVKKGADDVRVSASRLLSASNALWLERVWTRMRVLPPRDDVHEAFERLTRLSNRFILYSGPSPAEDFPGDQNRKDAAAARRLLGLPPVPWLQESS